jgi:hypothetical protein
MEEGVAYDADRTKSAQAYIDQLKQQNLELSMGAEWAAEFAAVRDGITEAQKAELERAKQLNKELLAAKTAEEERAAAAKAARDERQQEVDAVREAGEKFVESMKSPMQELIEKLTQIETMRRTGELSTQDATNAEMAAKSGFKGQQPTIKVELPPSLKAGSREEYKMIASIFSQNRAREEQRFREQRDIAIAQRVAAERAANALENMRGAEAV